MALFAYILAGTPLVPFHGDEATILFASRDYDYWFVQGDIGGMLYSETPVNAMEQEIRLRNGIVSKLLAGFAWHSAGYTLDDLNQAWDWGGDYNYNAQNGHLPSQGLLVAARWSSAVLLALGVFVVFALGWHLGGAPVAYLVSIYYALNPVLLLNGRRVMMEGSLTLFCLLVALIGIWFLGTWLVVGAQRAAPSLPASPRASVHSRIASAVLLGIVSGLALSSKQIAAFALIGVYGACLLYSIILAIRTRRAVPLRAGLIGLALASLITAVVFVVLNPVWWNDPIARTFIALQDRQNLLNIQVSAFGSYNGDALGGFWRQVFIALPQYYEVPAWQGYIGGEIAQYESSLLQGVSIGGSPIGGLVLLLAVFGGIWSLFRQQHTPHARAIIGGWALLVTLAALLLTPFEWQRYYLLVYPPLGLLAALGITHAARLLWMRLRPTPKSAP
ncbi:MAG: phospholipid carrier-dependent glycosyltransferase [Anaerolineae bacterium]